MICELDGSDDSLDAIYSAFMRDLQLPPDFGRNLDALFDVLTTDVPGPIEIVWKDHGWAKIRLGADYDRLMTTLRDVGNERDDFELILK
jgi:ribonuclease inhibitor